MFRCSSTVNIVCEQVKYKCCSWSELHAYVNALVSVLYLRIQIINRCFYFYLFFCDQLPCIFRSGKLHIRYMTKTIRVQRYITQIISRNDVFTIFDIISVFSTIGFTTFEIVIAVIYVGKLHTVIVGSWKMTSGKWRMKVVMLCCFRDTEIP